MKRLFLALLCCAWAPSAAAQAPPRPSVQAPPSARASAVEPAPPASAAPAPRDPHAGMANPHAGMNPHAGGGASPHDQPPTDTIDLAPDLPAGTIEVTIADGGGKPVPGLDLRLNIIVASISEGDQRDSKSAKTGANGLARFEGLGTATNLTYRVVTTFSGVEYASAPFNLRDTAGERVLLHVFPTTREIGPGMLVGMRGFLYVEARDDVVQLEAMFRVFNLSRMTWVPSDVVMTLPEDFKAFSTTEGTFDAGFEAAEGRGARLKGSFPPGQRDVSFRFQLPKPADTVVSFRVGLLPRIAEMRVIAAASKRMTLEVEPGFESPREDNMQNGDRVLVTRWVTDRGGAQIDGMTVTIGGLPVPSSGRWWAIAIAFGFAGFGFAAARGKLSIASVERVRSDRARARELLIDELVLLERVKAKGEIGPSAYDNARRTLLDALARIGMPDGKKRSAQHKARPSKPAA